VAESLTCSYSNSFTCSFMDIKAFAQIMVPMEVTTPKGGAKGGMS
jgi:hypothetical protein